MKVNQQALLEMCIDEGLAATVDGCDIKITESQRLAIFDKARREIFLQLGTYFDFK